MPELPEVEVVKRGLGPLLTGRTITGLRSDGKSLRRPVPIALMKSQLPGCTIIGVRRRAKYLLVDFDSGALLILHLGMTGTLGLFPHDAPELVHDHVFWRFDDGHELRFNDTRRFGTVVFLPPEAMPVAEASFFAHTGPEPFDPACNGAYFKKKAGATCRSVKNFIMDSTIVAGIGNIYANESLCAASIHPGRPSNTITLAEWCTLIKAIRDVLGRAISCGGATISDFVGADGKNGYFQISFRVYGKKGHACPSCSQQIEHVKIGGRATFFCATCQK